MESVIGFILMVATIWLIFGIFAPAKAFFGKYPQAKAYHVAIIYFGMITFGAILTSRSDNTDRSESTPKVSKEEKRKQDSIALVKRDSIAESEKRSAVFAKGEAALLQLKNGPDFSESYTSMLGAASVVGTFTLWEETIKDLQEYGVDGSKLARDIEKKYKAVSYQEWPKIRKAIADELKRKLWEEDIDVKCFGKRKEYIEFIGGLFAANKNIKQFQEQLHETLKIARFKQVRYRWWDGQDDYTYYSPYSGSDSDPIAGN